MGVQIRSLGPSNVRLRFLPGLLGAQGERGLPGPPNSLAIGTVAKGENPSATITGQSPSQTLNLVLPKGDPGPPNSLSIGTVTTVSPNTPASATITGESPNQTLNLSLPRGQDGSGLTDGDKGDIIVSDGGASFKLSDAIRDLLESVVRAENFGAVGDGDGKGGGTDDAAALAAALSFSALSGKLIYLTPGKVYRCDTSLSYTGGGTVGFVGGGTIDFTNLTDADTVINGITITGPAWGPAVALTANAVHPSRTVTVADATGFATGQVIRIFSNKAWATDGPTHSEFAIIDSVSGNTITLNESLCGSYNTADAAAVQSVSTALRPVFDITIQGGKAQKHTGLEINRAAFGRIKAAAFDCMDKAVYVRNSIFCFGEGILATGSDLEGYGYAFVDAGNQWCQWGDITGNNCRHVVSTGASIEKQISRDNTFGNIIGAGCRDAIFDTHSGCSDIVVGAVIGSMKAGNGSDDGIMVQGDRLSFGRISINGVERHGFYWQFMGGDPLRKHFVDVGSFDAVPGPTGIAGSYGIMIQNATGTLAQDIDAVRFGYVSFKFPRGVLLDPTNGKIRRAYFGGGEIVATAYHGIFATASAVGSIGLALLGTRIETQSATTGHYAMYLFGTNYTTAFPGAFGVDANAFGCEFVGGPSSQIRADNANLSLFGGSYTFGGTGPRILKNGIGAVKTPTLVDAT